jgi:hypothetical protein
VRTVGVEEELLLVGGMTGATRPSVGLRHAAGGP